METKRQRVGALIGGALLGLGFVIFLPFIGFAMLLYHLIGGIGRGVGALYRRRQRGTACSG